MNATPITATYLPIATPTSIDVARVHTMLMRRIDRTEAVRGVVLDCFVEQFVKAVGPDLAALHWKFAMDRDGEVRGGLRFSDADRVTVVRHEGVWGVGAVRNGKVRLCSASGRAQVREMLAELIAWAGAD